MLRRAFEQCDLAGVEAVSVSLDLLLADVDELLRWGCAHEVRS